MNFVHTPSKREGLFLLTLARQDNFIGTNSLRRTCLSKMNLINLRVLIISDIYQMKIKNTLNLPTDLYMQHMINIRLMKKTGSGKIKQPIPFFTCLMSAGLGLNINSMRKHSKYFSCMTSMKTHFLTVNLLLIYLVKISLPILKG